MLHNYCQHCIINIVLFWQSASQAAASRHGGGKQGAEHSATSSKLGMSLDEAMQILNVKELSHEQIQKNYEYLFKINDKSQGGSLYLQSKVSYKVVWTNLLQALFFNCITL